MKIYSIAIGAGLGYLAGNDQARRKAFELVKQVKASAPAKAVEERVSEKVTDLASKRKGDSDLASPSYSSGIADPSYVGGADNVDPDEFMTAHGSSRPSMVPR